MAGITFLIEITRGILRWPTGNPRLGIQRVTYVGGTVVESPLNLVQMAFFFLKSHKIVGNLEFVAIYRLSFIIAIYRWFLLVQSAFNAIYNEFSNQNDFPSPVIPGDVRLEPRLVSHRTSGVSQCRCAQPGEVVGEADGALVLQPRHLERMIFLKLRFLGSRSKWLGEPRMT